MRTWHFGFHTVIPDDYFAIHAWFHVVRPKILSKNRPALAHLQHRSSFPLLRYPCADVPWRSNRSFDPCCLRTLSRAWLVKMPVFEILWPTLHAWHPDANASARGNDNAHRTSLKRNSEGISRGLAGSKVFAYLTHGSWWWNCVTGRSQELVDCHYECHLVSLFLLLQIWPWSLSCISRHNCRNIAYLIF